MKKIHFSKYHGTGNDFIIIDNRHQETTFRQPSEIARLCDRHFGIGADGLILLENSAKYNFRMVYYNSDGKEGSMCGNGGRCIVSFAYNAGLTDKNVVFEATDGIHEAVVLENAVNESFISLKMNDVTQIAKSGNDFILNTGSPHFVRICANLDDLELVGEGRKIRYSDQYKKDGINVNFIDFKNNQTLIRTYERGVEDETLSCGTGSIAAAIVTELLGKNGTRNEVDLLTRGGRLFVKFTRSGENFTSIWLQGPAQKVFDGSFDSGRI